jgi:hypothetical protein
VTYLSGSHHHTTTDGVKRIGSDTSSSSDSPAEHEGGQEVTLKRTDQENRLDGVVHAKVQTTIDDYTKDRRSETTVETSNAIRCESLSVDIDETIELTCATLSSRLGVVRKTSTSIVKGVDEEEGSGTSHTTGGQVAHHPLSVSACVNDNTLFLSYLGLPIALLLECKHRLVGVSECKVESLGWEVSDNVGSVASPKSHDTLVLCCRVRGAVRSRDRVPGISLPWQYG